MPLTNSEYSQIMDIYDGERSKNRTLHEERYNEVSKLCPEYLKLEDEIISLSMQEALRRIENISDGESHYKEQIAALENRKSQLLADLGKPSNYLDEIYTCPDCKDTGYIEGKKCHCFLKKAVDIVYRDSNIKNITDNENFETFDIEYYSNKEEDRHPTINKTPMENMIDICNKCKTFISTFDEEFHNLVLTGTPGVGKTFLINCIAKELLDSSHSVIYLTASELFARFAKVDFNKNGHTDDDAILDDELFLNCDLLIIDDLGTEMGNSYTHSKLFHVINERMLRQKSVIISTNFTFPEIRDAYSERISSRLVSVYDVFYIFGDDIRYKKKTRIKSN